jgi:hypothetical protein
MLPPKDDDWLDEPVWLPLDEALLRTVPRVAQDTQPWLEKLAYFARKFESRFDREFPNEFRSASNEEDFLHMLKELDPEYFQDWTLSNRVFATTVAYNDGFRYPLVNDQNSLQGDGIQRGPRGRTSSFRSQTSTGSPFSAKDWQTYAKEESDQ